MFVEDERITVGASCGQFVQDVRENKFDGKGGIGKRENCKTS